MAGKMVCDSSLHGIDIDTMLSVRDIEKYVGDSDFLELAGMMSDGSHFTLWSILEQLRRRGIRTEILNKIIEGVRGASIPSITELQERIDELQDENARLKEELGKKADTLKNTEQQGTEGSECIFHFAGKDKPKASAVVRKMKAHGETDREIAACLVKNGYKKVEIAKALFIGQCSRGNYYKFLDRLLK